jgi:hypothetical protein
MPTSHVLFAVLCGRRVGLEYRHVLHVHAPICHLPKATIRLVEESTRQVFGRGIQFCESTISLIIW